MRRIVTSPTYTSAVEGLSIFLLMVELVLSLPGVRPLEDLGVAFEPQAGPAAHQPIKPTREPPALRCFAIMDLLTVSCTFRDIVIAMQPG
jgi:hypothetical protein